jgi:hypothetical protein
LAYEARGAVAAAPARSSVDSELPAKEVRVSAKKNFFSDNVSGVAPEILTALVAANAGDGLVAEGYSFSRRGAPSAGIIRIVCAFDTAEEDVDKLVATAKRYAGGVSAVRVSAG